MAELRPDNQSDVAIVAIKKMKIRNPDEGLEMDQIREIKVLKTYATSTYFYHFIGPPGAGSSEYYQADRDISRRSLPSYCSGIYGC